MRTRPAVSPMTPNAAPPKNALPGEEIAAALVALNVDPDAERIAAVRARIDADALPQGERAQVVRDAVDAACRALDRDFILQVEAAMKKVDAARPMFSTEPFWYDDPPVYRVVNAGAAAGHLVRLSTTQVQWTESGVRALYAARAADPQRHDAQRFAIGLDEQCHHVIEAVAIVERRPADEHGRDCVTMGADGIRVLSTEAKLYRSREAALAALGEAANAKQPAVEARAGSVRVSPQDLSGAALDWAVGSVALEHGTVVFGDGAVYAATAQGARATRFMPSQRPEDGLAIVEREKIELYWHGALDMWAARHDDHLRYGPTLLVAAMRAYVASRLGEEVEVPAGLAGAVASGTSPDASPDPSPDL